MRDSLGVSVRGAMPLNGVTPAPLNHPPLN